MSDYDPIRDDVLFTRGHDRSEEIRLGFEVKRLRAEVTRLTAEGDGSAREALIAQVKGLQAALASVTAERDEYARACLLGLSGLVPTPERGYVADGGLGQLRADFRELRALVGGLRNAAPWFGQ